LKEYIEKNPEMKKQRKEIQTQRYELYDKERLTNIERCKSKRNEIIAHSKKVKPKNYEEELEEEEKYNDNNNINKYRINNSEDNYVIRKIYSGKKRENEMLETNKNKILVTDNSYVMRDSMGRKAEIKKEEIDLVTCIKEEKEKLLEKSKKKRWSINALFKGRIRKRKKNKNVSKETERKRKNN
jgi:hypothetical protein